MNDTLPDDFDKWCRECREGCGFWPFMLQDNRSQLEKDYAELLEANARLEKELQWMTDDRDSWRAEAERKT